MGELPTKRPKFGDSIRIILLLYSLPIFGGWNILACLLNGVFNHRVRVGS